MATLKTQYENFKKEHPASDLTFEEWKSLVLIPKIQKIEDDITDWDVTLLDGLENEPDWDEENY